MGEGTTGSACVVDGNLRLVRLFRDCERQSNVERTGSLGFRTIGNMGLEAVTIVCGLLAVGSSWLCRAARRAVRRSDCHVYSTVGADGYAADRIAAFNEVRLSSRAVGGVLGAHAQDAWRTLGAHGAGGSTCACKSALQDGRLFSVALRLTPARPSSRAVCGCSRLTSCSKSREIKHVGASSELVARQQPELVELGAALRDGMAETVPGRQCF